MHERNEERRVPEPLELPSPLNQLPWDIAQDEFGAKGADFIGVMGALLLRAAQSQIEPVREWIRVEKKAGATGYGRKGVPA